MFTRTDARLRITSLFLSLLTSAIVAGCGDDSPAMTAGTGGSGGSGGQKIDGGPDVKADADAAGGSGGDASADVPEGGRDCYNVAFTQPVDMAVLMAADDKDGNMCSNGFQYDVKISSTDAPDGVDVILYAGNSMLATAKFSNGTATFTSIQLSSMDDTVLSIQFPSTKTCTAPASKAKVTVNCKVPTCTLAKPVISGAHPALNGVAAPSGDRASAVGSPYQAAFEVTTDIEDGRPVQLKVNNMTTPAMVTTTSANAMGGKATFPGVTLSPDAIYEIVAVCTAMNGAVGTSMKGTYPVDTTAPDLTISRPANGDFIGPSDLTAGKFKVCGKTTSTDAVALPASLGTRAANFCIDGTTNCAAVTAVNTDACVDVACPGGAPFNIVTSLTDAAGNPVSKTITGVACASMLPTVQIVAPVSDAPTFTDKTKHILAATATGAGQAKDLDGAAPGAQANVVACTDRSGSAKLFVGHKGDATLTQLGAAVMTTTAATGECPASLGFVAKFNGVTLPESTNNATGMLATATELRVDLTDVSTATGTSGLLDIWIDTLAPMIAVTSPAGLCGSFQQAPTTYVTDVKISTDTPTVIATVANGTSTDTYANPTVAAGVATFTGVVFNPGQNNLAAVATDPAGNSTTLAPAPCTVTVGAAPIVLFTNPVAGNNLCANGVTTPGCLPDSDIGVAGWQGTLNVSATRGTMPLSGVNVTFTIGATVLGMATLDAAGTAQLAITTNVIPEGSVTFTATTDNVPNAGVGVGTVTVNVDTAAPDAPTVLTAAVLDRRQTSFRVSWIAPDDHGKTVAGYDVRVATVPIDATNFDNAAITRVVPYTNTPVPATMLDSVVANNLNIDQNYFFAVVAKDAFGGKSPIAATTSPAAAHFLTTVLSGVGTDGLANTVDGTGDIGRPAGLSFMGDGLSDLVVGATGGKNVYVFFGTSTGYSTTPSITITMPNSVVVPVPVGMSATRLSALVIGDIDGDTLDDLAVSSSTENKVWIFSRKNPPASWGSTTSWPATLTDAQANYTITLTGTFANAMGIRPLARLGNFDNMGADDLGIGLPVRSAVTGALVIVKGSSTFASLSLPDATNSIEIDGVGAGGAFGNLIMGIGQFYPSPAGPTMVAGATIQAAAFAFPGQSPAGILTATDAIDSTVGTVSERYGATMGFMGPLGPSPGSITLGSTSAKFVDLHLGTPATGPFLGTAGGTPAASVRFVDAMSGNSFGVINLGGGIRGTSGVVSVLGNDPMPVPDLILAGQGEGGNPIYIVNGSAIPGMTGTLDVSTPQTAVVPSVVKVTGAIPSSPSWGGYTVGSIIPDSNGDGYSDFVIGENGFAQAGRAVVFY